MRTASRSCWGTLTAEAPPASASALGTSRQPQRRWSKPTRWDLCFSPSRAVALRQRASPPPAPGPGPRLYAPGVMAFWVESVMRVALLWSKGYGTSPHFTGTVCLAVWGCASAPSRTGTVVSVRAGGLPVPARRQQREPSAADAPPSLTPAVRRKSAGHTV